MENILRENTEINDDMHMMCAEGCCDEEPTEQEIERFLCIEGWAMSGLLDIDFDDFQSVWRWSCGISRAR